jgi:hypothetical protein
MLHESINLKPLRYHSNIRSLLIKLTLKFNYGPFERNASAAGKRGIKSIAGENRRNSYKETGGLPS